MDFFRNPMNTFTTAEKIQAYTEIYNQLNIRNITQDRINTLYSLAMGELTTLTKTGASLYELIQFCNQLMLREF
jgi:geranylgeranyl diphosphate synthase type II